MKATVLIGIFSALLGFSANAQQVKNINSKHFNLVIGELQRHQKASDVTKDLKRWSQKGYNGVYIENDYLTWSWDIDPNTGDFGSNFKLFNIFDFTLGRKKNIYSNYLHDICKTAKDMGIDVFGSFWIPQLNMEMKEYIKMNYPKGLGKSYFSKDFPQFETVCTCENGDGLKFISALVEQYMSENPGVRGLKVGCMDNRAFICDTSCHNAYGTTQADHIANLYKTVQDAMLKVRPDALLLVYYWHWKDGYLKEVCSKLKKPYYILNKMEINSIHNIEEGIVGEPIFDASILSGKPGTNFLESLKSVDPQYVLDMLPVGTGIDDHFFAAPPYPGRLYRRFKTLDSLNVRNIMDYVCGGHHSGSGEEAVSVFNNYPKLSEDEFLQVVAKNIYKNKKAQECAIAGWRAFDRGFGYLPVGLGNTGKRIFTGRFGFAWTMCISTPINFGALMRVNADRDVHWFSPYAFFTPQLAPRLETQFSKVLYYWMEASRQLCMADAMEGKTDYSIREAATARAHVFGVQSALNWCHAASLPNTQDQRARFNDICRNEIELTKAFSELLKKYPWVYDNNCWHPAQTPISQKGLGFTPQDRDPFKAKIAIMENNLRINN